MMNTSETPKDQLLKRLEEIENEKLKRRDSNLSSIPMSIKITIF